MIVTPYLTGAPESHGEPNSAALVGVSRGTVATPQAEPNLPNSNPHTAQVSCGTPTRVNGSENGNLPSGIDPTMADPNDGGLPGLPKDSGVAETGRVLGCTR